MTEPLWEKEGRPRMAPLGPVRVRAPAKINLHLGVGQARPDGFHEVATVYHAIALFDEVTARPADSLALTMDGEGAGTLALDDSNLMIKAVKALAGATGRSPQARLHLRKQIPLAAGLAGGSADAAATLVGMCINFLGINPIDALFYTAVINGLLAPPLLVLIMLVSNDPKIMGERTNNRWVNLAGWAATAIMSAAAIVLIVSWLTGG